MGDTPTKWRTFVSLLEQMFALLVLQWPRKRRRIRIPKIHDVRVCVCVSWLSQGREVVHNQFHSKKETAKQGAKRQTYVICILVSD